MGRKQLAILGSGWGATRLLKDICPNKYAVTVISPRNHHLFTPLLPAASIGTVQANSICEPLRPSCVEKGARYCEALADHVDLENRVVQCQSLQGDHYAVPFDRLIIAVGKQASSFGIPGVRTYAHFMKETADATRLRESFLRRLEEAAFMHTKSCSTLTAQDEAKLKQLLSIVVVGGGPTSVMFASELTDFIARDVKKMYPQLSQHISVHNIEWSSCAASRTHRPDQSLREFARARLAKKSGVQIHQGDAVELVKQQELLLKSGKRIPYGTLLWNAGTKAVPLVQSLDLPKERCNRLLLDPFLRCKGRNDIFAIGDCAHFGADGLPQTAQVADQQAAYLARQLNAGESFDRPFALTGLPSVAYSVASPTLARLPGVERFHGWLAAMAWRSSYLSKLSMRSRLAITSDALSTALFGRSLTRLGEDSVELPAAPVPVEQKQAMDEKLLSSILDDIGMRQVGDLMQMPPRPDLTQAGSFSPRPPNGAVSLNTLRAL